MVEKERYKADAALGQEEDKRIGAASIIAQKTPQAPASMMRADIDADRVDKNIDGSEKKRLVSDFKSQVSEFKHPIQPASSEAVALCVKTQERRAGGAVCLPLRWSWCGPLYPKGSEFEVQDSPFFQPDFDFDFNSQVFNRSGMNIAYLKPSIFKGTDTRHKQDTHTRFCDQRCFQPTILCKMLK